MGLFDFLKKDNKKDENANNTPSIEQGGFEIAFTEIQKDMISICLEYVEDKADKVYIYGSCEDCEYYSDFFYDINGKIYKRHNLPSGYDISRERQRECLKILVNDLIELESICLEFEAKMPTEIKIIYDIKNKKVDAKYRYDLVYSNTDKASEDISEEWFNEVSSNR